MVLHPAADEEDGGVIKPLLTRESSSTNATITQPQGATEGYYTMPAADQKYFHLDGEPQAYNPSRRHSIGGYQHHHHHHDLVVAPLRPLMLPTHPRRPLQPPVVVDEDAVMRKIDRRLMPLLFLTQMLASTDAAALASAVFLGHLSQDAHLLGSDHCALSAWFYLGYLLWAYPTCFFLSTLSTGGPAATNGKRGRSASNSSSFYTSMYSAGSSESLSLFFLSSASDSSSIISTSSDSSSLASVYSWDSESPNNKKGAGAGNGSGNRNGNGGGDGDADEDYEGIRFGVARYLGLDTLAWGAAVAATALTTSYAGLAAARFLLGAAEATVIPALMLVTSTWYARDEVPLRTGIWFAGGAAGDVVATLLGHLLVLLHGIGNDIENGRSSDSAGGDFGLGFFVGILPEWSPWRCISVLLGATTFLWGFVILYRLLDPASSSDGPSAVFPGSAAERQWNLDRVAAAESTSRQLWARSSHARPRPVPDWKWRQARDCLGDPQSWLIAAMCLLCQAPLASMRGLADLVLLGPGLASGGSGSGDDGSSAPTTMPMPLQITYMLLTMAATIGSGWLASRFRSLSCTLMALAALPPLVGSACIAKQLHYPSGDTSGNSLLDDDSWPPSPTHQILASMLLCTAPAITPLLLALIQVNVRGLAKKTTTQALVLAAYCAGNLIGPRLFAKNPYDELFSSPPSSDQERRATEEASYHTAVHTVVACNLLIVILSVALRAYLRRRNWAKQDSEMAEVIHAIETRGGVTEYSLYRGAVDDEASEAAAGIADDFDDMTDWKIPGFQYRY